MARNNDGKNDQHDDGTFHYNPPNQWCVEMEGGPSKVVPNYISHSATGNVQMV